jgi:hypothetical protein
MVTKARIAWQRLTCSGRDLWTSLAPDCAYSGCINPQSRLKRIYKRQRSVRLRGAQYCRAECLEMALIDVLRMRPVPPRDPAARRIPLGLLLLSRQQITAEQLRWALAAQTEANGCVDEAVPTERKKIGAWLQELGFATEQQVTAALARQWSCPLLRRR